MFFKRRRSSGNEVMIQKYAVRQDRWNDMFGVCIFMNDDESREAVLNYLETIGFIKSSVSIENCHKTDSEYCLLLFHDKIILEKLISEISSWEGRFKFKIIDKRHQGETDN